MNQEKIKQEKWCYICGGDKSTVTRGGLTLCKRCAAAIYHAVIASKRDVA